MTIKEKASSIVTENYKNSLSFISNKLDDLNSSIEKAQTISDLEKIEKAEKDQYNCLNNINDKIKCSNYLIKEDRDQLLKEVEILIRKIDPIVFMVTKEN